MDKGQFAILISQLWVMTAFLSKNNYTWLSSILMAALWLIGGLYA